MKTTFTKTIHEVAEHYQVNKRTISRWIDSGMLKYGVQYIDLRLPTSRKARLRFDLEALHKMFATPPEKR